MTNHVIDRAPVTAGLKAMLLAVPLSVEVGGAPANIVKDAQGRLVNPYGIVYPVVSVLLYGSLGWPQDGATLPYQVTSVGRNEQSAQTMADLVRRAVIGRTAGGGWVHPLTAGASMSVVDRRNREIGTAEPTEGLWQVVDVYDLEVQAV